MSTNAIIIAGAGEAGVAAAAALREEGYDGRILLVSDESGFPYQRPPLSKEALYPPPAPDTHIRPLGWYRAQAVTLLPSHSVVGVDATARTAVIQGPDGRVTEPFDSLLVATGARPRRLPNDHSGVQYLRTRADAARLRETLTRSKSLIVIGGGVIGLEVASTARSQGLEVTVVDPAPRLMGRAVAPQISAYLLDLHHAAGVRVILDSGPVETSRASKGGVVVRTGGIELYADGCLAGIGVVPNDELGRMAGCALDNGILVDGRGRTSVPGIFAAGDVAAFHHPLLRRSLRVEAWQHAGRHGAHVGRAMLGVVEDYAEIPWFWTDQLGVNIQAAGVVEENDETVWRGEGASRTALHVRNGKLCGVTTINNGRDMRPSIKLLAAGWSGDPASLSNPAIQLGKLAMRELAADAV